MAEYMQSYAFCGETPLSCAQRDSNRNHNWAGLIYLSASITNSCSQRKSSPQQVLFWPTSSNSAAWQRCSWTAPQTPSLALLHSHGIASPVASVAPETSPTRTSASCRWLLLNATVNLGWLRWIMNVKKLWGKGIDVNLNFNLNLDFNLYWLASSHFPSSDFLAFSATFLLQTFSHSRPHPPFFTL